MITFLAILVTILGILLIISLGVNIAGMWYLKQLLSSYRNMGNAILKMKDVMGQFAEHINEMYKKELYHGDATIRSIVAHSKEVVEEINVFTNSIIIDKDDEDYDEDEWSPGN